MIKIGVLATHPIQYHAPLFREIASRQGVDLIVYFCHCPTPQQQGDGFGVAFEWDVDLTSGYRNVFLNNVSKTPAKGFWGYDTPGIADIVKHENFDFFIVHGWAWKSCWQAFRACWQTGTLLGVRGDSQLPQGRVTFRGQLKGVAKSLIYPRFISRFNVCLPYGKRSAAYFNYFGGRNIVIAPHFVDNDWFKCQAAEFRKQSNVLREQWQIPAEAFCFLFCGKFQPKKHLMDLLQAMALFKLRVPDNKSPIHLLIVGEGELRSRNEEYARAHALPVTFAGFLNQREMPKAYAVADCLVLPSDDGETWGLVVNEAMACGLPAIVSDACGCSSDLILRDQCGSIFACGDIEGLAEQMGSMVSDKARHQVMAFAALSHIQHFSAHTAADIILEAVRHSVETRQ